MADATGLDLLKNGIAVVGMGLRLPGADNPEELLKNLKAGTDAIRAISGERILATSLPQNGEYIAAGYLDDIELFDAAAFGISDGEAVFLDPQQRLALEVSLRAFEDAGIIPENLDDKTVSVFTNQVEKQYFDLHEQIGVELVYGSTSNFLPARLARQWNFKGLVTCVDTACSSSLLALHLACNEIRAGDTDIALVAGINLNLVPKQYEGDAAGFVSSDGRSRAFSDHADGMSFGEAAVAVLLKPLDRALADKDRIQAVVLGSAANHNGGRAFSPTAPDSVAIADVVLAAWHKTGHNFGTMGYLEAHGSGTKLGDGLEMEAYSLARSRGNTKETGACYLSCAKSAIGHGMAASGLSSFVRAVLAVRDGLRFPILNAEPLNPMIDIDGAGMTLSANVSNWPATSSKRLAGVMSCGLSGTNVHAVLAGPASSSQVNVTQPVDQLFLSGRTPSNLADKARELHNWIADRPEAPLSSLCKTLLVGRSPKAHRFVLPAPDRATLLENLDMLGQTDGKYIPLKGNGFSKIICVMEGEAALSSQLETYRAHNAEFNSYAESCEAVIKSEAALASTDMNWFTFRYALFRSLRDLGCVGDDVVALGNGKWVAEAVSQGTASLCKSIVAASVAPGKKMVAPEGVVKKLLATYKSEEPVLFVFPGGESPLANALKSTIGNDTDNVHEGNIALCLFDSNPVQDILAMCRTLYLSGHSFQFDRFNNWLPGSKIAAPGEAFRKTRYWPFEPTMPGIEVTREGDAGLLLNEMTAIWNDILGTADLSPDSDFFERGGNSLAGVKLARQLRQDYMVDLEFEDVFDFPTLQALCDHLVALGGVPQSGQPAPIVENEVIHKQKRAEDAGDATGMTDDIASRVCAMFEEVLEQNNLGPESNFFELGGTSLLAAHLFTLVQGATGREYSLATLFEAQTVRELADVIRKDMAEDSIDHDVLTIIREVLNQPGIHADSNFFEVGGSSLMAAGVFARIRDAWGLHYSLSLLFEAQTPRALAEIVRRDTENNGETVQVNKNACLVTLRSQGDKSPIFLVHNSTGDVFQYLPLVQNLPAGHPIFGVCATGLSKGADIPSLQSMVNKYAQAIEATDDRPVLLIGHSIGGILAREIAEVLRKRGRRVCFLGLIDSGFDWPDQQTSLAGRLYAEVAFFTQMLPRKLGMILRNRGLMPGAEKPPEHFSWMEDTLNAIINRYGIKRYDIPVKLYIAPEGAKNNFQDDYGWQRFAPNVRIETLGGDHWTIMSGEFAPQLAEAIMRDIVAGEKDE